MAKEHKTTESIEEELQRLRSEKAQLEIELAQKDSLLEQQRPLTPLPLEDQPEYELTEAFFSQDACTTPRERSSATSTAA